MSSCKLSLCVACLFSALPVSAGVLSWTTSPAVNTSEVNNTGTNVFAYAFSSTATGSVTLNGVPFTFLNTGGVGGPMADSNLLTPGFERMGTTSYSESSGDFYQGPNAELNQILDGLTWGGTNQFQLNNLTPGTPYLVQLFSSDDRATQVARVLDLDSSWATPNGSRQLENIDYTAGAPWTDPAGRQKIFTGTFTADASTQQILAVLDEGPGTGQIDLNAIQLRIVPEPTAAGLLFGLAGFLGFLRRRNR